MIKNNYDKVDDSTKSDKKKTEIQRARNITLTKHSHLLSSKFNQQCGMIIYILFTSFSRIAFS